MHEIMGQLQTFAWTPQPINCVCQIAMMLKMVRSQTRTQMTNTMVMNPIRWVTTPVTMVSNPLLEIKLQVMSPTPRFKDWLQSSLVAVDGSLTFRTG